LGWGKSVRLLGPPNHNNNHQRHHAHRGLAALLVMSDRMSDQLSSQTVRPISIHLHPVSQSSGSCVLEAGNTKVICAVYGPRARRPVPGQKTEFTGSGVLEVDATYAPFALRNAEADVDGKKASRLALAVRTALEASVQLHRFPKSALDVYLIVLEDDGSVASAAITCASLALACAGVEMYDLVASVSLCKLPQQPARWVLDPTAEQEAQAVGTVFVSVMPARELVTGFDAQGPTMDAPEISSALALGIAQCSALGVAMRGWLVHKLPAAQASPPM
jgi:exosome complex component MTR3